MIPLSGADDVGQVDDVDPCPDLAPLRPPIYTHRWRQAWGSDGPMDMDVDVD